MKMRRRDFKGRCTKIKAEKAKKVLKLYDFLQINYVNVLEKDAHVVRIESSIPFEENGESYLSDFFCTKTDGEPMVRECVLRKKLRLPKTCELLDISRRYWLQNGVTDWGLVINKESDGENGL